MLHDFGNQVAEKYGPVFTLPEALRQGISQIHHRLARANSDDIWRLPIPARFVIPRQGIICDANADPNYRGRPELAQGVGILVKIK